MSVNPDMTEMIVLIVLSSSILGCGAGLGLGIGAGWGAGAGMSSWSISDMLSEMLRLGCRSRHVQLAHFRQHVFLLPHGDEAASVAEPRLLELLFFLLADRGTVNRGPLAPFPCLLCDSGQCGVSPCCSKLLDVFDDDAVLLLFLGHRGRAHVVK